MKPRTRYGILDGFGEVVRWQWNKPAKGYKYVTERVKAESAVDWNNFEEAPF